MSLSHPHMMMTGRKMQRAYLPGPERERSGRKVLRAALQVQSGPEDAEGILPGPESVGGRMAAPVPGWWGLECTVLSPLGPSELCLRIGV